MDNEQKSKDLANKHLKLQGVGLPIRFNRRVYKAFLNAISEALNIHEVSGSLKENKAFPTEGIDTIYLAKNGKEMVLMDKQTVTIEQYKAFIKNLKENQP